MQFSFYLMLISLVFYFIGHLFYSFWIFKKEYAHSESFFLKSTLGLSIVLLAFSIFNTGGNTIFSGMLILCVAYLIFERNRISFQGVQYLMNFEWKYLVVFLLVANLVMFIFKNLLFSELYNLHRDFLYYGAIADFLLLNGLETTGLGNSIKAISPNLYHYSNEWLVAFMSRISGQVGTVTLFYIYFPTIVTLLYFGISIVTKRITKFNTWKSFSLSTLFLLIVRLANVKTGILTDTFLLGTAGLKLSIVSIFLIVSMITYRKNDYISLIFVFLFVAFLWPTTLPGILGGVFLFIIYLRFQEGVLIRNFLVLWFIPLFYFGLFYSLQKSPLELANNEVSGSATNSVFYYIENDFNLISHFRYFFGSILIRFYYYLPFLILILIYRKFILSSLIRFKNYKHFALLYLFILISALIARSALYFITDSAQVFENIFDHTFMPILMYLLIIMLIYNNKKYLFIAPVLFVVFVINVINHSNNYTFKRNDAIHQDLLNEFYDKEYSFATHVKSTESNFDHINQVVYSPLTFLRVYSSTYFPVNMSIWDRKPYQFDLEKDISKKLRFSSHMNKSQFYNYVLENGISHVDWLVKRDFLQNNRIDYLAVEKGSLDDQQLSMLNIAYEVKTFDDKVSLYKLLWD